MRSAIIAHGREMSRSRGSVTKVQEVQRGNEDEQPRASTCDCDGFAKGGGRLLSSRTGGKCLDETTFFRCLGSDWQWEHVGVSAAVPGANEGANQMPCNGTER
jgi:hypothetical protein